jgi:hypothetical protein
MIALFIRTVMPAMEWVCNRQRLIKVRAHALDVVLKIINFIEG